MFTGIIAQLCVYVCMCVFGALALLVRSQEGCLCVYVCVQFISCHAVRVARSGVVYFFQWCVNVCVYVCVCVCVCVCNASLSKALM